MRVMMSCSVQSGGATIQWLCALLGFKVWCWWIQCTCFSQRVNGISFMSDWLEDWMMSLLGGYTMLIKLIKLIRITHHKLHLCFVFGISGGDTMVESVCFKKVFFRLHSVRYLQWLAALRKDIWDRARPTGQLRGHLSFSGGWFWNNQLGLHSHHANLKENDNESVKDLSLLGGKDVKDYAIVIDYVYWVNSR